jgi:cytochrome c oxidase subunit II
VTLAAAGGSFDPQGPAARSMAELWWLMLVLGIAVFAVFAVLLAGGLLRRRRADADADAESMSGRRFTRWVVGGGVVMPVVVLVVVFAATVEAMRDVPARVPDGALVVDIVGHQWWWEVRYPGEGVTTANVVHLPVGRPVALQLTSADVIHSFWVPALGGKLDLLPDGTNTLVLQADQAGEHRSNCAEFCGLQHAEMGLLVVAEAPDRFAAWIAGQREPAAEPVAATARRGQELFAGAGCASCHTVQGTRATGAGGPDLTHVASRPSIGAGVVPNTTADLAAWVEDPHTVKEGVGMPASKLSAEDLDAVVAYLETLR